MFQLYHVDLSHYVDFASFVLLGDLFFHLQTDNVFSDMLHSSCVSFAYLKWHSDTFLINKINSRSLYNMFTWTLCTAGCAESN